MSVHPTTITRSRRFAILGSIVASLAFAGVASADEPAVTHVEGNPSCAEFLGADFEEVKVEPVRQGRTVFGDGDLNGSLDVKGLYFNWTATPGVDAVIVKGGPTANVYRSTDEMANGTGLHAPDNGGKPYGLSHISFCTDGVDSPAYRPAPAPGPCEPGGAATMPDGSPCAPAASPSEPQGATAAQPGPAGRGDVRGTSARGPRTTATSTATAQMSGPGLCVSRSFAQVVRGKGIRKVTLSVNGRKLRTFTGRRTRYAVSIDPREFRSGVMRVTARVVFVAASGRRAQTLRMSVLSCTSASAGGRLAFAG